MRSIFFLAIFFSSFAGAALPQLAPFCAQPLAFVCGEGQQGADLRWQSISQVVDQLKAQALVGTSQALGRRFQTEDEIDWGRPRERRQAYRVYRAQLREAVRRYLQAQGVSPDFHVPQTLALLTEAIQNAKEIPAEIKPAFLTALSRIRFVSVTEHESAYENTTADLPLLKHCGRRGLADNAFAWERRRDAVVVICPGFVIGTLETSKRLGLPRELWLAPLMATLAHELAHHFDGQLAPQAYAFMLAFLQRSGGVLKPGAPLQGYMGEATADFWGNRVMHSFLKSVPPIWAPLVLKGSLADLCGTEDEGIHPSGAFRITQLATAEYCAPSAGGRLRP